MRINPLLKFLSKSDKKDIRHSSGYAKSQNGDSFGASGGNSFSKRQKIDDNRKVVRGYAESLLGRRQRVNILEYRNRSRRSDLDQINGESQSDSAKTRSPYISANTSQFSSADYLEKRSKFNASAGPGKGNINASSGNPSRVKSMINQAKQRFGK